MDYQTKVDSLRAPIPGLQQELSILVGTKHSRDDLIEKIRATVETAAEEGARQMARMFVAAAKDKTPKINPFKLDLTLLNGGDMSMGTLDLTPILAHLLGPDVLIDSLILHLEDVPSLPPAAQRAKRIAELQKQLDEIETQEEALIVQSESMLANPVLRRKDCRPEILLALK